MDSCTLRLARIADAARIAAMSERYIEAGLAPSWPAARIARHLRDPDSVVLCAVHASAQAAAPAPAAAAPAADLAGFAIMRFADSSAHLNLLAVDPRWRRRGIGTRLLGWLEETALTAGTFHVSLELRSANQAALDFYRRLGYRETGTLPGYYQGVETAIRMSRDVREPRDAVPGVGP